MLQKQITKSGITIPKIKEAIINVCNAKDTLRWMESFLRIIDSKTPPTNEETFRQEYVSSIQQQLPVLHDVYTFLRMLKPMEGKTQKNIVFYGGLEHMDNLKIMLETVGFREFDNESINIKKSCLLLKNVSYF